MWWKKGLFWRFKKKKNPQKLPKSMNYWGKTRSCDLHLLRHDVDAPVFPRGREPEAHVRARWPLARLRLADAWWVELWCPGNPWQGFHTNHRVCEKDGGRSRRRLDLEDHCQTACGYSLLIVGVPRQRSNVFLMKTNKRWTILADSVIAHVYLFLFLTRQSSAPQAPVISLMFYAAADTQGSLEAHVEEKSRLASIRGFSEELGNFKITFGKPVTGELSTAKYAR